MVGKTLSGVPNDESHTRLASLQNRLQSLNRLERSPFFSTDSGGGGLVGSGVEGGEGGGAGGGGGGGGREGLSELRFGRGTAIFLATPNERNSQQTKERTDTQKSPTMDIIIPNRLNLMPLTVVPL